MTLSKDTKLIIPAILMMLVLIVAWHYALVAWHEEQHVDIYEKYGCTDIHWTFNASITADGTMVSGTTYADCNGIGIENVTEVAIAQDKFHDFVDTAQPIAWIIGSLVISLIVALLFGEIKFRMGL